MVSILSESKFGRFARPLVAAILVSVFSGSVGARESAREIPPSGKEIPFGQVPTEQEVFTLRGHIKDLKTFEIGGIGDSQVFAKIETGQGKIVKADLGPRSEIEPMQLKKGDPVTVHGVNGAINARPMLIALQVISGRKEKWVRRPACFDLERVRAKVLDTRVAEMDAYKNVPEQLFARIRMENGEITMVALGPVQNFSRKQNLEGKTILLLARKVRISGKYALVAEEVRIGNGSAIDIKWTETFVE